MSFFVWKELDTTILMRLIKADIFIYKTITFLLVQCFTNIINEHVGEKNQQYLSYCK